MKSSETSTSKSKLGSHPMQGSDPCISAPKGVKRKAPLEVVQDDPELETVFPDLLSKRDSITPESSQKDTHFTRQASSSMPTVTQPAIGTKQISRKPPLFIEACAGCAILSATAQERGIPSLPIDCSRNRHQTHCKVFDLDLSKLHALELIKRISRDYAIICVHIALPRGTCSKARGIPMADGSPGPPPLRSPDHLHGVPSMSHNDRLKVGSANRLYATMSTLIVFLEESDIPWTVENASNSWLWELPEMAFPLAHGTLYHFHSCAYGAARKKRTAILASDTLFACLERQCDGQHPHAEWGFDEATQMFNTAKEAEYPKALCQAYVDVLLNLAGRKEIMFIDASATTTAAKPQKQPRGRKTPQLISEYGRVETLKLPEVPPLDSKRCLMSPIGPLPKGAKLLRTEAKEGNILCVFGIYRSMEEFVTCSKQLWHPFDELRNLPDGLIRCIFKTLTSGMAEVTRHRIEKLTEWSELAKSLSRDEEKLHQTLDPNVAAILKGKRLLLLERLAEQISWPDKTIHKELKSGFMLTGYAPPSGIFKPELRPASLEKAQLMADSKYIRPLILSKLAQRDRSGDVPEKERDDEKLFEITLTEAHQKHWLQGPFTPEQIASRHEDLWLPVRRFGVWQKEKLRPIDDMKENKLNDCFSCSDKIDLRALDHVLWSLCVCIRFCLYSGDLDFKLSDGSRLHGSVHESWTRAGAHFSMTSFDLASAYKQLPLNPKEHNCSVVTLRNPKENSVACFEMRTLPFGSVASVLHFNRVARLIWALGLQLGIIWGNYFDDYPVITHDLHKASTMTCVKNLFGLLGFDFAEDKLAPFAKSAETLGVIVNLTDTTSGRVVVDNKDSRKAELSETIQTILSNDALVPAQLPSVLGRMQFADMQLAGRMGGLAMADLRSLGHDSKTKVSLPTSIRQSLEVLNQRFAK